MKLMTLFKLMNSPLSNLCHLSLSFQKKKKNKKLFLLFVGVVVAYSAISYYPTSKPEEQNPEPFLAPILKAPVPALSLKEAVEPTVSLDEQKQHLEDEKLHKIRMLAPGVMYTVDNQHSHIQNSSNNTASLLNDNSSNAQFMSRVGDHQAPVVMASHIQHPSFTLAQGTLIWATLETQITSNLPGMIRAVTSQNIYSEDGSRVILPRGSRLIGQYTSSVTQGQNRVFAVWQRVIRPDHIDIQLNSPGTDPLGAAGIGADGVNRHFWAQFGSALLLSMIGAGTATIGVDDAQDQFNSAAAYREALSNSFSESASNSLESTGTIKPTLFINQGKKISVFVAQDLDFYNELSAH